ncbi:transcriptional regulator GcvA [Rhizobium sp. P44RR-XXIV]|uniref:transcriptional regulator GcvA n=1 Tax=Rhizobium sp. P44RR-XXIV TaxID=1921145 RepID=UPI0009847EED|nr:transcriptional regulator GcvA [Rhizobium sp. P44RR-XXIV]TIX88512.1 transcriptional regulator GcvA [Rhizobium sp. P44RR-XXIV]
MRRLPPLGAVRAFEAGARHLNFTRAADELCVTQAAISHQVHLLEDWLGVKLFERAGHSLRLTDKGSTFLMEVSEILDRLAAASSTVGSRQNGPLRLTVLPSFASSWLVPRLKTFRERHADIDLRLSSSPESWDFSSDGFDIAIRSGLGRWRGLKTYLIAHEALSPVCTPSLAATLDLKTPDQLLRASLLHDTPRDAWSRWLNQAGVSHREPLPGMIFNDHAQMLQAAMDGQGVALGRLFLAGTALRDGRLVQPFDMTLPNDFSYWFVCPGAVADRPDVIAFRTWLLSEAQASGRD